MNLNTMTDFGGEAATTNLLFQKHLINDNLYMCVYVFITNMYEIQIS